MKCVLLGLVLLSSVIYACDSHLELSDYQNIIHSVSRQSSDDNLCQAQLAQLSQALSNDEEWAVRLTDTWAKIQAGFLSGNVRNLGDFDSCIRFRHDSIRGRHCWVTFTAHPNSTLESDRDDLSLRKFASFLRNNRITTTNGFCLPASCSTESVVHFLNERILLANDLVALGARCRPADPLPLDPIDYFAIVLFALVALLLIASTSYEVIMKHKAKEANKLLISFSVYTNGAKLYDVTKSKGASSLNCLHGLRAMSIFWIIFGHRMANQFPWGNPNEFAEFNQNIWSSVSNAYHLAVDTFFLMGALLMTWATLRDCEKRNLNIARMIWRRYIRYTPVYGVTILAVVSFSKYLLRGPYDLDRLRDNCVRNWWRALLHIQNYIPGGQMCLSHGWYLSADFQLFLISPFVVYLMHKYGKKLLALPIALVVASIIYILTISIMLDIRWSSQFPSADFMNFIYYPTYSRVGPWFIGMVLGYFMYAHRGKTIRINKWTNAALWILSLSVLCTAVLGQHALSVARETSIATNALFIALFRNLWAVALCWIVFACQHLKTGGIVRWFLSLPQWQPISRMGLSMYILGSVYQIMMILNQRTPLFLNVWHVFPVLWSDFAIIILLSTISYLAFEVPLMLIEEQAYRNFQKRSDKKSTVL